MRTADDERYDWLCSQRAWHEARARRDPERRAWHRSQQRHYADEICAMRGMLTRVIAQVFHERVPEIARNIEANNAALTRFLKKHRA